MVRGIGGFELDVYGSLRGEMGGKEWFPELEQAVGGGGSFQLVVELEEVGDVGWGLSNQNNVLVAGQKVVLARFVALCKLEGLGRELCIRTDDPGESTRLGNMMGGGRLLLEVWLEVMLERLRGLRCCAEQKRIGRGIWVLKVLLGGMGVGGGRRRVEVEVCEVMMPVGRGLRLGWMV